MNINYTCLFTKKNELVEFYSFHLIIRCVCLYMGQKGCLLMAPLEEGKVAVTVCLVIFLLLFTEVIPAVVVRSLYLPSVKDITFAFGR